MIASATVRVRPDVNGCVYDERNETFVVLDHARDWDADDPLVVANPEVFEMSKPKPARKPKE